MVGQLEGRQYEIVDYLETTSFVRHAVLKGAQEHVAIGCLSQATFETERGHLQDFVIES